MRNSQSSNIQNLGPRLELIISMIERSQLTRPYDCLWDCCCDHGYLGMKLLQRPISGKVYFVDQVPHITESLAHDLGSFQQENVNAGEYEVLTEDAGNLSFSENQRHIVILAGITGTNVMRIMRQLIANHTEHHIDYIVCPTRGNYDVREFMRSHALTLIDEALVSENSRQYEVMYVSSLKELDKSRLISEVGRMWDTRNPEHLRYLRGTILHYQREAQVPGRDKALRALKTYQQVIQP